MIHKFLGRAFAALAALILLAAPPPLFAQATSATTLPGGIYLPGGAQRSQPQPVSLIGYDSVTSAPCVVGTVSTCVLSTTAGGGSGSLTATASASALPVVAGTGKPLNIDLFSSLGVKVRDASGNDVDWSAAVPVTDNGGSITVDGTVAISGVSGAVSLPTGAATAAKQPAFGTAGTPSPDVVTIQGASSMTPLLAIGVDADDTAQTNNRPVSVGGIYSTPLPTYAAGDRTQMQFTAKGELITTLYTSGSGLSYGGTNTDAIAPSPSSIFMGMRAFGLVQGATNWERSRSIAASFGSSVGVTAIEAAGSPYARIASATTTTVKSGAGILHRIVVNTLAAGSITVYDNTTGSGTIIAVINSGVERDVEYDLAFATGLTIVTSAAADLTVVFR